MRNDNVSPPQTSKRKNTMEMFTLGTTNGKDNTDEVKIASKEQNSSIKVVNPEAKGILKNNF